MKIGELSRRTGVAARLLRYYEEQGLIVAGRSSNGYRHYTEDDVALVERVAGLVRSGVPTRVVRSILEFEGVRNEELIATCTRGLAEELAVELTDIEERIDCLTRSRDTLRCFLARTRHRSVLDDEA